MTSFAAKMRTLTDELRLSTEERLAPLHGQKPRIIPNLIQGGASMTSFAAKMRTLIDELRLSREGRLAALHGLSVHTRHVLSSARCFVKNLHRDHKAMARQLKSTLAGQRRRQSAGVEAMRRDNRKRLRNRGQYLRGSLSENRAARQEAVGNLLNGFRHVQKEIVNDLGGAAGIWRGLNHFKAVPEAEPKSSKSTKEKQLGKDKGAK